MLTIWVVCGLSLFWMGSSASAGNARGVCNSIVARGLGTVAQLNRGIGNPVSQCGKLAANLAEFTAEGCFDLFFSDELGINRASILGGEAERLSPLGVSLCTALVDECRLPLTQNLCE